MKNVIHFANQILDMENELIYLRARVAKLEKYEQDYNNLIRENIAHSSHMMGSILQLAMTPGVTEALAKNREVA